MNAFDICGNLVSSQHYQRQYDELNRKFLDLQLKYTLLQRKYEQMRALEPVPGKSYFRHKATNRMVCPKCYNERNGALYFLTEANYNNNKGMECQACKEFYSD